MSNSDDSNLDIIGVDPGIIVGIMGLITIAVQYGVLPTIAIVGNENTSTILFQPIIYGLLWILGPEPSQIFSIYNLSFTWTTIPFSFINLLFFWQIVRYYQGKCTKNGVAWVGAFSITLPTILAIATFGLLTPFAFFPYIVPIPIQFIAGFILIHRIPGPEFVTKDGSYASKDVIHLTSD